MSEQTDTYTKLLEPYGFSHDEAFIYLDLLSNASSSALAISRRIGMSRTKVYRVLDILLHKEMVVQSFDDRGFKFAASTPEKLQQLLESREGELATLKRGLPQVVETLERLSGYTQMGSKVLYYSGSKGLERVNFNMLRAEGELVSFEIDTANAFLDTQKAEYMRKQIVEAGIHVRTITNATHIAPFTKVTKLATDFLANLPRLTVPSLQELVTNLLRLA